MLFGDEFQNSSGLTFGGVHSRAEIGGNKSGDERKMDRGKLAEGLAGQQVEKAW